MKLFICTLGTLGDILPFLELAKDLRKKGFHIVMMSNVNWREISAPFVDEYIVIAPQDESQSGRNEYQFFKENTLQSYYKSFEYLEQVISKKERLLVIYRSNMKGCEYFCEKHDLPSVKIYLQPSSIKSILSPPWPLNRLSSSKFSSVFSKVIIPIAYYCSNFFSRYRMEIDKFRLHCDMQPLKIGLTLNSKTSREILFCPDWFASPQIDWPKNLSCVGFVKLPTDLIDPSVTKFIEKNGRPIVFTPGTGVTDVSRFFDCARLVCESLSVPGIFLSKELKEGQYGKNILCLKFHDLGALLSSAKCIVHHGGIGTTYRALEASIPQIIIPNGYDQPDNAYRIAKLGFGAAIYNKKISAPSLATVVKHLIDSTSIYQKLQLAALNIQMSSAIEEASVIVSALLEGACSPNIS